MRDELGSFRARRHNQHAGVGKHLPLAGQPVFAHLAGILAMHQAAAAQCEDVMDVRGRTAGRCEANRFAGDPVVADDAVFGAQPLLPKKLVKGGAEFSGVAANGMVGHRPFGPSAQAEDAAAGTEFLSGFFFRSIKSRDIGDVGPAGDQETSKVRDKGMRTAMPTFTCRFEWIVGEADEEHSHVLRHA